MFNDKSPYTIRGEVINNVQHYFVSFVDGENIRRDTEVSRSVFLEIYKSIKKARNLTRSDERHIEKSDMTEETLYSRAVHPTKNVEDVVIDIDQSNLLRAAIADLSETQRRRFILHYDFGRTYEQIAVAEGCSFQSVGKSILLAEEKIKTFFENRVEK